ncbi:hypothetical protein B0H17DRAFT_1201270 [Mycena rosella]|uniref:Uncharacterized protein n=1 Tax=Mycena rosella TaxID=1033263 RepID=A0AAD7GJQ9_MYCRO|nr:hypothetical protein B0H17DRAFT_1201270 [Mycena rosella]
MPSSFSDFGLAAAPSRPWQQSLWKFYARRQNAPDVGVRYGLSMYRKGRSMSPEYRPAKMRSRMPMMIDMVRSFAPSSAPSKAKESVSKKRKRRNTKAKDRVNAHPAPRALRLGADNPRDASPAQGPPVRRARARAQTWEEKTWARVPANLGVMRRAVNGPAVGFVRNPAV